jgi:ubiquinone/menaquinone biosynthesis C-methylase UbiE
VDVARDTGGERSKVADEQANLWNGPGARAWVEGQEVLDEMFRPFEHLLVEEVAASSSRSVLDVGCGTGSTTLAVARRLGAAGRCVGVDLSEPMISVARARAEREGLSARFISGDAQVQAFEPAGFDMFISRFGVMFFESVVTAFANLRRAARDGAGLRFIVWRTAAENPFMTAAERAAAPLLPTLPARRTDGPGQFALADAPRVSSILQQSGWSDIDLRPINVECAFPERELIGYFSRMGPVGMFLRESDDRTRAEVIPTLRAAFDPFVHGAEVRFTAACWLIGARASASAVSS